jgi:hypothetical protein
VTAQALERKLNGHRRIQLPPRAIVTPLAVEHLRDNGIQVDREEQQAQLGRITHWGYTQDREHPLIASAVQSLSRDGMALQDLPPLKNNEVGNWAREVAACVAAGQCCGGVVFCTDPGLFCCVTNKVPGLRAVAVGTVLQFEIRQILRLLCSGTDPRCPEPVACTLRELDGHAHR